MTDVPQLVTKAEAAAQGLTRFYTGVPCPKGHLAERRVNGGHCVECHRLNAQRQRDGLTTRPARAGLHVPAPHWAPSDKAQWPAKEDLLLIFTLQSRNTAILQDAKRFFTGEPCRYGHIDERTVASGSCVACAWSRSTGSDVKRRQSLEERIRVLKASELALPAWPRLEHEDAKRLGLKRYFVGIMCKNGHVAERYVGNHECTICSNRNVKERYANDPDFRQRRIDYQVAMNRRPDVREKRLVKMSEYNKRPEVRQRLLTRIKVDPQFKLVWNIRTLLRNALKSRGGRKQNRLEQILGCSVEFFVSHMARQFQTGMTWGNHGEWEIDHIVPLNTAATCEDVLALFHYTNLRPLWKAKNREKGGQILFLL